MRSSSGARPPVLPEVGIDDRPALLAKGGSGARTDGSRAALLALRHHVRDIPDFPKPGIVFRDITPLFLNAEALRTATEALAEYAADVEAEYVVSAEARGFVLGGAIAARIGAGFIVARKPGKLPRDTDSVEYQLEYGVDALEMHSDALRGGARVLVHDDLLATGGTAGALCGLVEQAGAEVAGCAFVIELAFLDGRGRLAPRDVHSLISYDE
ncbi:MAG TPA: adenine phosphoribosyltransferase [Thermoleophilaceae bacterium]|nr:adenine phosphoribosyltransferase [Thermoleophilaceae bacterium]